MKEKTLNTILSLLPYLGYLMAAFSIIQTWRINKRTSRKRRIGLYYKIIKHTSLENIDGDPKILYEGTLYSKISKVDFILGNIGNVDLTQSDFANEIQIIPTSLIKILNYQVVEADEIEDKKCIKIVETEKGDVLVITKQKFLVKEGIKFSVVFVPLDDKFSFNIKLIFCNSTKNDRLFVNDVSYFDSQYYTFPDRSYLGCTFIAIYVAILYYSFIYTQRGFFHLLQDGMKFTRESSEILSFFVGVIPAVIITYLIYLFFKKDPLNLNSKVEEKQTPFGRGFNIK